MRLRSALVVTAWVVTLPAATQEAQQGAITFRGRTITMLVGSAAGGGTDATGRLVAPFLTKYLPGNPAVCCRTCRAPTASWHRISSCNR